MTEQPQTPATDPGPTSGSFPAKGDYAAFPRGRDIQAYHLADDLSGALTVAMVIFGPWAFGTTQPWAIWCMNLAEYVAGLLLLFKLVVRQTGDYHAPRWDNFSPRSGAFSRHQPRAVRKLKQILAWLTVIVLAECLISALNAAAYYSPETRVFHYRPHLEWLPHSFDGGRTWFCFWQYLGLAAAFWAVSDWLAGLSPAEERSLPGQANRVTLMPVRLRTLLWVLTINGTLLGIEGIVQRESGTDRLLFLLEPRVNRDCIAQFASYAYRSNAAQYFNLLWPVCLGFWWTLQCQGGRQRNNTHHWLLPCAAVIAACPSISSTRGGALISAGMLLLAIIYLTVTWAKSRTVTGSVAAAKPAPMSRSREALVPSDLPNGDKSASSAGLSRTTATSPASLDAAKPGNRNPGLLPMAFIAVTLALAWYFGWKSLAPRMEQIEGGYEGRDAMQQAAEPMVRDYPLFGTGPGSFATVFQLYRFSDDVYWSEQAYDDWLEIRITLGWLGFGLLLAALAATALRGFLPGGVRGHRSLVFFAWVALGGCLLHARFDIPFQIHSTLFVFLLICAILLNLGRTPGISGR